MHVPHVHSLAAQRFVGGLLILVTLTLVLPVRGRAQTPDRTVTPIVDPHSASRPQEALARHIDLDLGLDFDQRQLDGTAIVHFENVTGTNRLWLDTRGLRIQQVELINQPVESGPAALNAAREPAEYTWHEPKDHIGRPLEITITPATRAARIEYTSTDESTALQWLTADQTSSRRLPFLYTQSQAAHARTWFPCQDSPGIRTTYTATVRVPPGMMAVMSAANPTEPSSDGVYHFEMRQPIPSYLYALAAGNLQFRALGNRAGVYAEPPVINAAAYEFAETERMISAAENLYGPYRWERYDVLVLPPSFPFGGMENPRLTFATPTVLTGDRSLVNLIAHELAHSWSGNLVTNATWNDFWLNEGFTVYFEHRIMESVFGRDYDEMLTQLGKRQLRESIRQLSPRDTWLKLDLTDRDPDEGMSDIAYEKGYLFLRMVEEAAGRERFDAFLREYFDTFAFQSMTTEQFLEFLKEKLIRDDTELARRLHIDEWVYGPGLPDNCPLIATDALRRVASFAQRFVETGEVEGLPRDSWTTHHWLHFLRSLPKPLPLDRMARLDEQFQLTASPNSEITHDWLLHAIAAEYEPAMPRLEEFLSEQGRRKYLRPLYEALAKTPDGMARAREIYQKARPTYHAISTTTIDAILQ